MKSLHTQKYSARIGSLLLLILLLGCSNESVQIVRKGYLQEIEASMPIENLFNVLSLNKPKWSCSELADKRWSDDRYSLVEAELTTEQGPVTIQFVVSQDAHSFELQGASLNGVCVDANYLLATLIEENESVAFNEVDE